jgi:hypothetical protein
MSMTKEELATSNRRLLIGTRVAVVLSVGGAVGLAPILDKMGPPPPPTETVVVEKHFLDGLRAIDSRGYMIPESQQTPVQVRIKRPTLNCMTYEPVYKFESAVARHDAEAIAQYVYWTSSLHGTIDGLEHGFSCGMFRTGTVITVIDCEYHKGLCFRDYASGYGWVARAALEPLEPRE